MSPAQCSQGLIACRAQRGAPAVPRTRRSTRRPVGRKPKAVPQPPVLPPLNSNVSKPIPVPEEEVLEATEVKNQSLKDVATEVWRGGRALFVERWSDVLTVRTALNLVVNAIAKERVQVRAGLDEAAVLRERRRRLVGRLLRDAARRLFVRVKGSGELCLEGGPTLGYVPVMYADSTEPLVFRANDVTALNVAWQFFLNGLDYSFLEICLNLGRVLDLGTGCGVISFLLRQHFPDLRIVASDRCPNAVFSVQAELQRRPTRDVRGITVKRSDLFDDLKDEVGTSSGRGRDQVV
eukprot:Skav223535  [mRNA]  locus=scaffold1160:447596:450970:+ [translate_table: standard]